MSQSNLPIRSKIYSDFSDLAGISEQWHALTLNVLEQNINYDPIPLMGLINHELYKGWRILTFWSGDEMVGLFPMHEAREYPVPIEQYAVVYYNYFLKCVPLVHKQHAELVVRAYVDWINSDKPKIVVFNESMEDSIYRSLLLQELEEQNMQVQALRSYDRAIITDTSQSFEQYLQTAFKAKSRSTLKRKRKQLHAAGNYRIEMCSENNPERIKELIDATIEVEAKSWKMENGSAMACREDIVKFAHDTAQYAAQHDRLYVAVSYLDDVAIAAYYGLVNDNSLMCIKIGYDDAYAKYSPGLVLMLEVVEDCLENRSYSAIDSCAAEDASMFNRALQERMGLTKIRIGSKHPTAMYFLKTISAVKTGLKGVKAKIRPVQKAA